MKINEIDKIFFCPECKSDLLSEPQNFQCVGCKNKYYFKNNIIDFLPKKPLYLPDAYSEKAYKYYKKQFLVKFSKKFKNPKSWTNYKNLSKGYQIFVDEEEKYIKKYFPRKKRIFCDISGSSGEYALNIARDFSVVLICDINLEYLYKSKKMAEKRGIENIFFVRLDYFRLPFKKNTLDMVICTDSLIYYGRKYDLKVIKQVHRALNSGGKFVFDLHAMKFYARDKRIFEYTPKDLYYLKKGLSKLKIFSFGRFPTILHPYKYLFKFYSLLIFLPPVRYLCVVEK